MIKNAYRFLLFLVTISLLFIAADIPLALAQTENEPDGFQDVTLWIYPELDDPRLLVMLEGQIVGVPAPATVRFLVPSGAEIYSAGSMDAQGQYSGGPPNREPSAIAGWDEISYEVTTETFRIEYYDPIIIGQPDKTISYEFRWLYPISELEVVIQEPRQSSNFSVSPNSEPFIGFEEFTYHQYNYSDLDDQPPLRFDIAYTKSNPNPSLAIADDGATNPWLITGVLLGLVLIFGAGYLWMRRSRPKTRAERRRSTRGTPARGTGERRSPRRFCSQCGQPAEQSSQFCAYCGAKLR